MKAIEWVAVAQSISGNVNQITSLTHAHLHVHRIKMPRHAIEPDAERMGVAM
ncbi:hypothetical protein OPW39_16145 [Vibrio europaeus]|uniref:hypothetical protein n=1 Tax=Vibrio europaeus TaxID=300876 RepID=UPI00233E85EE|nr:hypothetical protein [Vibrio europaeus]MDC5852453.1 hypothetical protein [Vibrio europaeus]MDC5870339.1 hypothetical protein [Vibrio europaeus]